MTENRIVPRGKYVLLALIAALLMLCVLPAGTLRAQAAENVVALARKNVLKGGTLKTTAAGTRYYVPGSGYVKNQWAMVGGSVYLFDEDGYAATGTFCIQGKYYCTTGKGVLYVNRLRKSGTQAWYYGADGAMVRSSWVKIAGKYYYFSAKGTMVKNTRLKESYVGADGARVTSKWVRSGGKYYYYNAQGLMRRNMWIGSSYVGADGAKVEGLNRKSLLASSKGKKTSTVSYERKLIIVGASRVVMMHNTVGDNPKVIYIARKSQGYSWLKSTAEVWLDAYLQVFPNSTVVIQLGNNDLKNINLYLKEFDNLITKYPNVKFRFMDALPGTGTGYNKVRQVFNKKLKERFPLQYIGGYDYMVAHRFQTVDGTHYTPATSRMIYRYILQKTGF